MNYNTSIRARTNPKCLPTATDTLVLLGLVSPEELIQMNWSHLCLLTQKRIQYMSQNEIQKSLELLKKDWEIDPLIQDFILGKISEVSDYTAKIKDVVFHIPYLTKEKKYIFS